MCTRHQRFEPHVWRKFVGPYILEIMEGNPETAYKHADLFIRCRANDRRQVLSKFIFDDHLGEIVEVGTPDIPNMPEVRNAINELKELWMVYITMNE